MDEEDQKILEVHKEAVQKFKDFCIDKGQDETFEETDFKDLSLGFFIALGVENQSQMVTDEAFYDAHRLASICRYTLQYWESEWKPKTTES